MEKHPHQSDKMPELINPDLYTPEELLKLVYRDVRNLKEEFNEYKETNDQIAKKMETEKLIIEMQGQLNTEKELRMASEKRTTRLIAIIGVGIAALTLILKFVPHG